MANWSECTIEIQGEKQTIEKAKETFSEEKYADVYIVREDDDGITISLSGRWSGPSTQFHQFCITHNCTGIYIDAESGSNFFVKIKYEAGILSSEINEKFYCRESIEEFGADYFTEHYAQCLDLETAAEMASLMHNEDTEDWEEIVKYWCIVDDIPISADEFSAQFDALPGMNCSDVSFPVALLCYDEEKYIVEAEKVSRFVYKVLVFDNKENITP